MFFPFFPLEERGLPSRYKEVEIRKFTQVGFPQVTESGKYSSSCPNMVHPPQVKFNLAVEFFFFFLLAQTCAPCNEILESQPLDCWGSTWFLLSLPLR